jgi:Domain of unknown function (DUF4292)
MNKTLIILILASFFTACKAKKVVVPTEVSTTVSDETASNIIDAHYAVKHDFKTAYIKSNIDYSDPKQSLGLSADIRIKKDEIILVSVKMLGITMAKALITPTQVKYYEKLNSNYFEGDYKMLSNWLGTDLDFQKVQNMLLGKSIDDLNKGKYKVLMEESNPKLEEIREGNFAKSFVFEPQTFWLKKQEIKQFSPERKLLVNYTHYNSYPECVFPTELAIFAIQAEKTTSIAIQNKNVTFNEELTFPYSVPSGYKQIIIK